MFPALATTKHYPNMWYRSLVCLILSYWSVEANNIYSPMPGFVLFCQIQSNCILGKSFLLLHSFPLCEYNNIFLHSPVDEHVSTFQFGDIANSTAINILAYILVNTGTHFCWCVAGTELLGHMYGKCMFSFIRCSQMIFQSVIPIYTSSSMHES